MSVRVRERVRRRGVTPASCVLGLLAGAAILVASAHAGAQPAHLYLTWRSEDTSRRIVVNFQTFDASDRHGLVHYDTVSRGGTVNAYRFIAQGTSHRLEGLEDGRVIHWIELTDLRPGQAYWFVAGTPESGFSKERWFRTLPAPDDPEAGDGEIRFFTGGDMGAEPETRALLGHAAKLDPAFGLIGGDLAYANADFANVDRWDRWFDNWEELCVAPDGRMIPMVLAVGNHEVGKRIFARRAVDKAPFYFGFFAQSPGDPFAQTLAPGAEGAASAEEVEPSSYFLRRFGPNVAILALDSGHVKAHGGRQTEWLKEQLEGLASVPQRFAVYHVPLYPSYRHYLEPFSVLGRSYWLPLFDEHRLTAAFENHDHTFKRSKPLRGNRPHPDGVLYLGDGSLGRSQRRVGERLPWYLEKWGSEAHFWFVTATRDRVTYRAHDTGGRVFDEVATPNASQPPAEGR